MLHLSVLDQSPIPAGTSPAQALHETLALAELCDRLGYHRYWLAEHHATGALAGSAPEILIAAVADRTRRIRVGSGGVMLSHYSPLKVAENFRVLSALHPGRIDLGLGRAPGSDQLTAAALSPTGRPTGAAHYPQQVFDLMRYLYDAIEPDHPFAKVRAQPGEVPPPPVWLLGSSDQSAQLAGRLGMKFSFAHFINPADGPAMMSLYRDSFAPGVQPEPEGNVAVFALAAPTAAEAQHLAKSRDLFLLRLATQGDPGPYPTPEEADAYPYSSEEMAYVRTTRRRGIVGDPDQVKAGIAAVAQNYGVNEVVVVTICHDRAARRRSYELLAQAFGLA